MEKKKIVTDKEKNAMKIHAPYNFVPLSTKVFFPDWADDISHEIPFEDGVSGTINIEIKAESPILISDGKPQEKRGDNATQPPRDFSVAPDGRYFIPATSIKGMVRNVMQIMTYSKIAPVADSRFAFRDLSPYNPIYKSFIQSEIRCGYLSIKNGNFIIEDHGIPGRISIDNIDKKLKLNGEFSRFIRSNENFKEDRNKTAKYKYSNFIKNRNLEYEFLKDDTKKENNKDKREFYKIAEDEKGKLGKIVLTGQPGERKDHIKPAKGKFYEFIIFHENSPRELSVNDITRDDFEFVHQDVTDWKDFWKTKLYSEHQKIPVFFRKDAKGKVIDFGLAYLYKLPYRSRIKDLTPQEHKVLDRFDLTDCILGRSDKKQMLKGRVQFSPLFAEKEEKYSILNHSRVLGSPRASYYPAYLKPLKNTGLIVDYNESKNNAVISGYKRYPLKQNPDANTDMGAGDKVVTQMNALDAGVVFKGVVNYHNLRPAELGALLSVLTFHNTAGHFHQLGMGKPYGYGRVSVLLKNGVTEEQRANCLKAFEQEMVSFLKADYTNASEMKEFSTLTKLITNSSSVLSYLRLSTNPNINEFVEAKKKNLHLPLFSNICKELVPPSQITGFVSCLTPDELSKAITTVASEGIEVKESTEEVKTLEPDAPAKKTFADFNFTSAIRPQAGPIIGEVIKFEGRYNKVKFIINGQAMESVLVGYSSELAVGTLVEMIINQVDKQKKILQLGFRKVIK